MADDSKIQVVIELDDGSVKQGFIRMEKAAQESTGKIAQFFQRAGSVAAGILIEKGIQVALSAIKNTLGAALKEAISADAAVNKLNTSLRLAGSFSKEASESFQSMATELQKTTAFSDDQALSAAALARNFAKTNEQAIALTKAAADLAVATGTDLDTAVTKLGGTLSGSIGLLGKQVPALKNLSEASLEAGGAITVIADRFSGAAALGANTFAGSITKLSNALSDVFEETGRFVTQSPALLAVFNVVLDRLIKFSASIAELRGNSGDVFKPLIISITSIGQALVTYVIAPFEFLVKLLDVARLGSTVFVESFSAIPKKIEKSFAETKFGSMIERLFGTPDETKSARAVLIGNFDATVAELKEKSSKLGEFNFSAGALKLVTDMQQAAEASQEPVEKLNNNLISIQQNALRVGDGFSAFADGFKAQAKDLSINATKNFEAIGKSALNSMGQGVGNAFAAVGRAVAKGENALKAFTNAILAAFGQVAIQLGTQFILTGIAYTFAGYPGGPGLIAAGAALAAFGGILSAIGGGGGGGTAAGPGAAGGFAPSTPSIDETGSVNLQAQQRVVVNIQGDVLDSRETSLRIVELINEGIAEQGAQITARAN